MTPEQILMIIIGILAFVTGYLVRWEQSPTVKLVKNIDPTLMEDKEYVAVYPTNGLPDAHFTHEEYNEGAKRLANHPEDKQL